MLKRIGLLLVVITSLILVSSNKTYGAYLNWEVLTTIPNVQYACGVTAYPNGSEILTIGRGGYVAKYNTSDFSIIDPPGVKVLPTNTSNDSFAFGTILPGMSEILLPDEHGNLFVVDPVTLTVNETVYQGAYDGAYRVAVASDGSFAVGSHPHAFSNGWVYYYDLLSSPINSMRIPINGQPSGIAITPDNQRAITSSCCGEESTIHIIDLVSKTETIEFDLSPLVNYLVSHVSIDTLRNQALFGSSHGLVILDLATNQVQLFPSRPIGPVHYDPVNDIYITVYLNQVFFIDPGTHSIVNQVSLNGSSLCKPETSPDGTLLYVGDIMSSTVYVLHREIIDTSPPVTTINVVPVQPTGTNEWYTTDVSAAVTAEDMPNGSGLLETRCTLDPLSPPISFDDLPGSCAFLGTGASIIDEGIHTIYAASTDNAGNKETLVAKSFKIDKTPPGIFIEASKADGSPYLAGRWTNQTVTLHYECSDQGGSGIQVCPEDQIYSTDGIWNATSIAVDNAGNETSIEFGPIQIDKTAPELSAFLAPADPASSGWYNQATGAPTLSFTCSDAGSGIHPGDCPGDYTFGEGADQSYSATVTDLAGNTSAPAGVTDINVDLSNPQISFVDRSPLANQFGWNNTNVTVTWGCADDGSGPVAPSVSEIVTGEGVDLSVTGTCQDVAGNSADGEQSGIQIDRTPPVLNPVISPNPIILNGSAAIDSGASDDLSGIDTQSCGPLSTGSVGSKTVTCTASDKAGNTNSQLVSYNVIYRFLGFLQPINDTAHQTCPGCPTSIFKGGSTVPVKFQIADANGNLVHSTDAPLWLIPQQGGPTFSPVDEIYYSDPATTGVTYQLNGDHYAYNWKTKGYANGYYWRIGVRLDDGQTYVVYIGLR